jgi:hypothetical protein
MRQTDGLKLHLSKGGSNISLHFKKAKLLARYYERRYMAGTGTVINKQSTAIGYRGSKGEGFHHPFYLFSIYLFWDSLSP